MTTKGAAPTLDLATLRSLPGGDRLSFEGWSSRAIAAIFDTACGVLAESPGARQGDTERLAHRVWTAGRSLPVGANDEALDLVLSREPRAAGPVFEIAELIRVLLGAGDLHATLLAQRRALDVQIEQLARLRSKA